MLLIEYFDNTILKNLPVIKAVKPAKAVVFYDKKTPKEKVEDLFEVCKKYVPDLKVSAKEIYYKDPVSIEKSLREVLEANVDEKICINLTGGNDFVNYLSYSTGKEYNVDFIYGDINKNSILSFPDKEILTGGFKCSMEDIVRSISGRILTTTNRNYLKENKEAFKAVSREMLVDVKEWSAACYYFQKRLNDAREEGVLNFSSNIEGAVPSRRIMNAFADHGLVENLSYTSGKLEFDIKDHYVMNTLSTFGIWLELHTFYAAGKVSELSDINTSMKLDWNRRDGNQNVDNELDVTAMLGARPVVMSCKSSEKAATAEALNEVYVVTRRLGGEYGVPMLITVADIHGGKYGLLKKGKEMGIAVLGYDDIMSPAFSDILLEKIIKNKKGFF